MQKLSLGFFKRLVRIILLISLHICTINCYATSIDINKFNIYAADTDEFSNKVNSLGSQFKNSPLGSEGIEHLILKAKSLEKELNQCIDKNTSLIELLKLDSTNTSTSNVQEKNYSDQIQKQILKSKKELYDCRFFLYQTQQLIYSSENKLSQLSKSNINKTSKDIYILLEEKKYLQHHLEFKNLIYIDNMNPFQKDGFKFFIYWLITITFALLFYTLFPKVISVSNSNNISYFVHSLRTFLSLSLPLVVALHFIYLSTKIYVDYPPIYYIFFTFFIILIILFLSKLIIHYFIKISDITYKKKLFKFLHFFIFMLVLNNIIYILFLKIIALNDYTMLISKPFAILFSIILFACWLRIIYLLTNSKYIPAFSARTLISLRYIGFLVALILIMIRVTLFLEGYDSIAFKVNTNFMFCLLMIFVTYQLVKTIYQKNIAIQKCQNDISTKIHILFEHKNKKIFPIYGLSVLISILILFVNIKIIAYFLNFSYLGYFIDLFYEGFNFSNMLIVPLDLINACICYFIFSLIGMYFKYSYIKSKYFYDIDKQKTLMLLVGYFFNIVGFIFSILVLGFQLTQLSIIIGGISFGLGMGINKVFLDFISGLVLVLQKPIKVENFITINLGGSQKISGIVQKIMLLSTEIIDHSHSVMYLPNSLILSNVLVNHSLYSSEDTTILVFSIKHHDDFQLAKSLVLNFLENEKNILNNKDSVPLVFLDSSVSTELKNTYLKFHVSYQVANLDKKTNLQYYCYQQIKKILKENNIEVVEDNSLD